MLNVLLMTIVPVIKHVTNYNVLILAMELVVLELIAKLKTTNQFVLVQRDTPDIHLNPVDHSQKVIIHKHLNILDLH